ncbi:threonine aldolase family protein [Chondrinema litorale]|uniref:threonine aldolase family protein n=1 Tax=Chondrinema litorale TaxID=2994555 RepID=UPI0025434CA8|nr:aminotransferase class I/II-fold pyridoxal phosphate-dependent enzyme [Chondrinema litorale]UZR94202.1 aminotransferase class I/II-fold pyridoxal phosphate-dependent enzyme [Chondrinema litorale]
MKKTNKNINRRNFLRVSSLSPLSLFVPSQVVGENAQINPQILEILDDKPLVNMVTDGIIFSPKQYLEKLLEINQTKTIGSDIYGKGGATKQLEEAFAKVTGKEKAIYVPTGTMANQLAMKLLNGENTKIVVPENSHIYRDEADAAQSVHNKRLIPAGKGKAFYNEKDLAETITYYNENEVFKSGLGTVVVECPVRRADGVAVPIETIKNISEYARAKGYKLHLDGARLHLASAYTGVSIKEYASYFDTVYISLYKYLNASSGAMLCGDAEIIDQMEHQIKILGGTTYQTWDATAMAQHYLEGIEERWAKLRQKSEELINQINRLEEVRVSKIENGTNIYNMKFDGSLDAKQICEKLLKNQGIWLRTPNEKGEIKFYVNESMNNMPIPQFVNALKDLISTSKR